MNHQDLSRKTDWRSSGSPDQETDVSPSLDPCLLQGKDRTSLEGLYTHLTHDHHLTPKRHSTVYPWHRSLLWNPVILILGLITLSACGSDSPLTTNPSSSSFSGTRVQTPDTVSFSEIDEGEDLPPRSLKASFVIPPDQLQSAATTEISIRARSLDLCVDVACTQLDPTASNKATPIPGSETSTPKPGIYSPNDLTLRLTTQIPETGSLDKVNLNTRFQINTHTLFIAPGNGVRFGIQEAYLQDALQSPQQSIPATEISEAFDFDSKMIIQGVSSNHTFTLTFNQAEIDPRFLRLDVIMTSPVPPDPGSAAAPGRVLVPTENQRYHALSLVGTQADPAALVGLAQITAYTQAAGKAPAWVAFAQRWADHQTFPAQTADQLRDIDSVPYIRLILPREGNPESDQPDPKLAEILAGEQDAAWQTWAQQIKAFQSPVMIGYGADAQAGESAPRLAQLQQVYQRIHQIVSRQEVPNVTWIFLVNDQVDDLAAVYPGEDQADWLGIELSASTETSFRSQFDPIYEQVTRLSATKPIILARLGVAEVAEVTDPITEWVGNALQDLSETSNWPRLIGWAWDNSSVSLQDSLALAGSFDQYVSQVQSLLGKAMIQPLDGSLPQPLPSPTPSPTDDPAAPSPGAGVAIPTSTASPSPGLSRPSPDPSPSPASAPLSQVR